MAISTLLAEAGAWILLGEPTPAASQMVMERWCLLQRPCDIRRVITGAELISASDGEKRSILI